MAHAQVVVVTQAFIPAISALTAFLRVSVIIFRWRTQKFAILLRLDMSNSTQREKDMSVCARVSLTVVCVCVFLSSLNGP